MTNKRIIPVKAGVGLNYGKLEYYYSPLDEKGQKLLQTALVQAGKKPDQRKTFSESLAKAAERIGQQAGLEIVFTVQEAAPMPKVPEVILKAGDVVKFGTPKAQEPLDLGFLA